jgi:hypothetical protein
MRHSMTQSKGKNYDEERSSGNGYSDALWINGGLHDQVVNSSNTSCYYIAYSRSNAFRGIGGDGCRDSRGFQLTTLPPK